MRRSVFGKMLWDQRRSLLAWAIGITAVGTFYAAFYPMVNTPAMRQALESYPQGMLEALGMTDATSVPGYLGSTTFGLLCPTLIVVFAAAIGGSAIAGEEEADRLDLVLAHPASRWAVLWQRFAAIGAAMLGVCLVLAAILIAISVFLTIGLLASFVATYYYSASTMIYLLLRREVDATELEEVYVEEEFEEQSVASETETPPGETQADEAPTQPADGEASETPRDQQ